MATCKPTMNIERMLRGIAGAFIFVSVVLAVFYSTYWLIFTAFVGLNLFQSAFTNWCPMMLLLQKIGFSHTNSECKAEAR